MVQNTNTYVDFGYTYDDNGNILTQDFNHRTSTPANQYTYDTLDRLTQADYLLGIQTANEEFVYDDLGNRLTLKVDGSVDTTYSHNSANEYTHINSGTPNVAHDAAGNLSADQDGYEYAYDHDNRLTTITKNSGGTDVATYTYDALGRRVEFIDEVGTVTTRYYYDGWRVLTETNGSDTVQRDYIYGNYIDEVLVMNDGTDDYYYAHDHLFSVVALMDDTGAVEEYYEYDAYGKVDVLTNPGTGTWWDGDETHAVKSAQGNPYTFTGRRLDSLDNGDRSLMYYRNRYYDFAIGTWLSRDSLEYIDGINLYEYVRSRPLLYLDPFGTTLILDPLSPSTPPRPIIPIGPIPPIPPSIDPIPTDPPLFPDVSNPFFPPILPYPPMPPGLDPFAPPLPDPFGPITEELPDDCTQAKPSSDYLDCGVHRGVILQKAGLFWDAECVCLCAGNSDWNRQVRGCLACMQRKGVAPNRAHEMCYDAADKKQGGGAGFKARSAIGGGCLHCVRGCPIPRSIGMLAAN